MDLSSRLPDCCPSQNTQHCLSSSFKSQANHSRQPITRNTGAQFCSSKGQALVPSKGIGIVPNTPVSGTSRHPTIPVSGGMIHPSAKDWQQVGTHQAQHYSGLHQRVMEATNAAIMVMAHEPQLMGRDAVELIGHVMKERTALYTAHMSHSQNDRIHQEAEVNAERRHQEKILAKSEQQDWRTTLSKKFDDAIRQVSQTSCSWAAMLSLHATAASTHAVIISAYKNPIAFMNNIVCEATIDSDVQTQGDRMPQDPATLTWNKWFTSSTAFSSMAVANPYVWMKDLLSWADDASSCTRSYVYWIGFISFVIVCLSFAYRIPYLGQWVNPLCTVTTIAFAAKNFLAWGEFGFIVVMVLVYAAAFSLGLLCYYLHARAMLTSRARYPSFSEVNEYGEVFENVGQGLVVTQIVVAFCVATQWCLVNIN